MSQIKNSFDQATLTKVGKGALIAASGAGALYILSWITTLDFGSTWTPLIAMLVPIFVNAIKEWKKGN